MSLQLIVMEPGQWWWTPTWQPGAVIGSDWVWLVRGSGALVTDQLRDSPLPKGAGQWLMGGQPVNSGVVCDWRG